MVLAASTLVLRRLARRTLCGDGAGQHRAGAGAVPQDPPGDLSRWGPLSGAGLAGRFRRQPGEALCYRLISAMHTQALCSPTHHRPRPEARREPAAPRPHTSRHPAYACLCSIDRAPRKTPEKLASPPNSRTRNRWSGACTPARGAPLTSGCSGGGSRPSSDHRVPDPTKALVAVPALCSRPGGCPTQCCLQRARSRETRLYESFWCPWPLLTVPGSAPRG